MRLTRNSSRDLTSGAWTTNRRSAISPGPSSWTRRLPQAKLYIVSAPMEIKVNTRKRTDSLQSIIQTRDELSPLENHILDWHDAALKGQNDEALRFIREAEKLAPEQHGHQPYRRSCAPSHSTILARPSETYRLDGFAGPEDLLHPARHRMVDFGLPGRGAIICSGNTGRKSRSQSGEESTSPKDLDVSGHRSRRAGRSGRIDEARTAVEGCLNIDATGRTPGDVMMEAARELHAHGHRDASREIADKAIAWAESRPGRG